MRFHLLSFLVLVHASVAGANNIVRPELVTLQPLDGFRYDNGAEVFIDYVSDKRVSLQGLTLSYVERLIGDARDRINSVKEKGEMLFVDENLLRLIDETHPWYATTWANFNDRTYTEDLLPYAFYSVKERALPPAVCALAKHHVAFYEAVRSYGSWGENIAPKRMATTAIKSALNDLSFYGSTDFGLMSVDEIAAYCGLKD